MNMKDRWLYVSAALVLVMATAACQEELSLEPVMETPAREEYRPWFRSVEVNVCGMDEFEQAGTKGAITSGGVSAGKWNSGESKVNSWRIGVYDEAGVLFAQKSGTGSLPSDLVLEFPVSGGADVIAIANWPDYSFPLSYADAASYVFHFTKDRLISNGVPAYAELHVDEGEVFVNMSLKRLVSKVNFKLSNPDFRAFTATEVSLHNVAMDSRSGTADGYVVKDFDYATAAELASVNAGTGASDSYTISFICPENLKGTVPSIGGDPGKKIPANAPEDATYLEVKGHVTDGGFGDGDVSYRFYLGANATTSFNLERNKIYNVTLSINEGNMEGYQDNATWKVDVGDFDYTGWDYWWEDPTTGFTSRTCVIGEHRNAKLFIRMPEYYASRDPQFYLMMGTLSQFEERFDPDEDDNVRAWLSLDGDCNYFDGEPYYNNVGYFCFMDDYEDPYGMLDNYGACCSKTRMAFSNTLRSSAITNSNVTSSSFNTGSLSNGGLYSYYGIGSCEKLSWKGYYVSNSCPDANRGCYIFDIQATTVTGVSDDVDFGDWAWVLVYYDDDHCFSIPVYVSEDKMAFNVNTQGQYAYVGQKLTATAVNSYGTVNWTLAGGGSFVGLNSASGTSAGGTSVNLICKAAGTAVLRCQDGAGKTYTKNIEVREPILKTKFRQMVGNYSRTNAGKYSVKDDDFALTLDGVSNPNFAWWYVSNDGLYNKLTFSDQSVFSAYVGTCYQSIPQEQGGVSEQVFNNHIGLDRPAGNYGECTGAYLKTSAGVNSNQRTFKSVAGYPMTLTDKLTLPTNEKTYTDIDHGSIPCPVLNPVYGCRTSVGLTNATKMTGMTCTERTTSIPKEAFYNTSSIRDASSVALVKSSSTSGADSYQLSPSGTVTLANESSDTQGSCPVAHISLKITNGRDGSVATTSSSPTSVVTCYLLGCCMRRDVFRERYNYDTNGPRIDIMALTPCVYVQNNATVLDDDTDAFGVLYEKAGAYFSWMRSNRFDSDNLRRYETLGILAEFWLQTDIDNHARIHFGNAINMPMMGRTRETPDNWRNQPAWTWAIPTEKVNSEGEVPAGCGLTAVETYSAANPHPMIISDTPLFELYFDPNGTPVQGVLPYPFWQNCSLSDGNIVVDEGGYWGMYIDLGCSTSYSAVLDNGYTI